MVYTRFLAGYHNLPQFFAKSCWLVVHVTLHKAVTGRNFYMASRAKLRSHELKTLDKILGLVI